MHRVLTFAALTAIAASAQAASITNLGSTLPSANVKDSYIPASAENSRMSVSYTATTAQFTDVGQIFTATDSYMLDKVVVGVWKRTTDAAAAGTFTNASLTMKLFQYSAPSTLTPIANGISTAVLASAPASGDWLAFDVDDVSISSGSQYAFIFQFDNADTQNFMRILKDDAVTTYTGGRAIRYEATLAGGRPTSIDYSSAVLWGNTTDIGADLAFQTIAAVPEPASLALVALSAYGLVRRRRD